ncbi:uncharacterized protein LOC141903572 [Tubulanus polymorphus]|uniref:uncharacterized protein LOC141903572 n=1 Tax=Tubulanus polymorphus TaxID=672921 RepID=UPI003DA33C21
MTPKVTGNDDKEIPEKNDEVSSLDGPDSFSVDISDSDSDDEEGMSYEGYQLIPQEPGMIAVESDPEIYNSSSITQTTHLDQALQNIVDADFNDSIGAVASSIFQVSEDSRDTTASQLWNENKQPQDDIKLDKEQTDKIKSAMAGIKLPASNIPDWAKVIPEDQWKCNLISKLQLDDDNNTKTKGN